MGKVMYFCIVPRWSTLKSRPGEGLDDCAVGSDRHFFIEAVDRFGNRVVHGGDNFKAELKGPVPEKVILGPQIRIPRRGSFQSPLLEALHKP